MYGLQIAHSGKSINTLKVTQDGSMLFVIERFLLHTPGKNISFQKEWLGRLSKTSVEIWLLTIQCWVGTGGELNRPLL